MKKKIKSIHEKIGSKNPKIFISFGVALFSLLMSSVILLGDSTDFDLVKLTKSRVTASSKLVEKGLPESFYNPEKAADGDIKTSWCANAKGDSIVGQSLTLEFQPTAANGFKFFPGVGASGEWYMANNRITVAKITVTDTSGKTREFTTDERRADCYDYRDPASENVQNGKSPCGFSNYGTTGVGVGFQDFICVKKVTITVLKVERGLKYDDTCVSETGLKQPGGAIRPGEEWNTFAAGCR